MKIAPLKISLFFIITLSILMLVTGLLCYKNFIGLLGAWSQSNKMNVYLKVDSTAEDKNTLITLIKEVSQVSTVDLIDRTAAGLAFQSSLKEFSSGLITEDEMVDLIPETIEVDLQSTLNINERETVFNDLAAKLATHSQVDEVSYSASWLKKFELVDKVLRSAGVFVFLVILISISYLVALMVRAYIEDSKHEIEVYSLLGATRWSIYQFFLKDVFIFLTTSLVTSFGLLFLVFTYLKNKLSTSGLSSVISDNLHFLSFTESIFVVSVLFLFIYINSFITIQTSVNKLNQLTHD